MLQWHFKPFLVEKILRVYHMGKQNIQQHILLQQQASCDRKQTPAGPDGWFRDRF